MPRRRHWTQHPPFGILGFCCSGQGGIIDFSLSIPGCSLGRGQHRPPGSQHPVLIPTMAIALHSSSSEGLYTNMAPFKSLRLPFACQWAPIARAFLSPLPRLGLPARLDGITVQRLQYSKHESIHDTVPFPRSQANGMSPSHCDCSHWKARGIRITLPWLRSHCSENSLIGL